jgi:hypothetical protein
MYAVVGPVHAPLFAVPGTGVPGTAHCAQALQPFGSVLALFGLAPAGMPRYIA